MDVERLIEQTDAFADVVTGLDPETWVVTCPEWQVRDLVGHIGQAHRWAAELVRTGEALPVPDPREADPGAPATWSKWLRGGADELVEAIRDTGPDTIVWTFLGPRPAMFWLQRMLYDTSVHRVDAALTAGIEFEIPAGLAADAIDEGLTLLSTPGVETLNPTFAELRGDGETLQFQPDGPGWLITRTPDGVTWRRTTADADVVVTATVQDLLLIFNRRLTAPDSAVTGDKALLDHFLACMAT